MKKFAIFTVALSLAASMLVGCGCMNTEEKVPTLPTNGETASPSTQATTTPTTMPTTAATTEAATDSTTGTANDTTGPMEGAMDDIMGGSADDATTATDGGNMNRSRGRRMPMP
jgi:hypothetical protein